MIAPYFENELEQLYIGKDNKYCEYSIYTNKYASHGWFISGIPGNCKRNTNCEI